MTLLDIFKQQRQNSSIEEKIHTTSDDLSDIDNDYGLTNSEMSSKNYLKYQTKLEKAKFYKSENIETFNENYIDAHTKTNLSFLINYYNHKIINHINIQNFNRLKYFEISIKYNNVLSAYQLYKGFKIYDKEKVYKYLDKEIKENENITAIKFVLKYKLPIVKYKVDILDFIFYKDDKYFGYKMLCKICYVLSRVNTHSIFYDKNFVSSNYLLDTNVFDFLIEFYIKKKRFDIANLLVKYNLSSFSSFHVPTVAYV